MIHDKIKRKEWSGALTQAKHKNFRRTAITIYYYSYHYKVVVFIIKNYL